MRLPTARIAAVSMFAAALFSPVQSQAALTITPTLVVIEGRQRFGDINLINTGDKAKTYEIGWRHLEMIEGKGNYVRTDKSSTEFDLTKSIVFTPRRVTLEPNALQKIRLAVRLKGEPPAPGDYRAHLHLKETGAADVPRDNKSVVDRRTKIGVGVNVGFSIPVIYRVGESDAIPTIGNVTTRIDEKSGKIQAVIPISKTEGSKFGIMGGIRIYTGDKKIGEQQNANIFAEVSNRTFEVPLDAQSLKTGTSLKIVYEDHHDVGKRKILAEKTMTVGQ